MQYAICSVSAAPVRKDPSHRSEMISQQLFGEMLQIIEEEKEWYKVRSTYDNYEGWVTNHLVTFIEASVVSQNHTFISTGLLNPVTLPDQLINLPMGSSLTGFNKETRLLWDEKYKYHGTYRNTQKPFKAELFWNTIQLWINAPYLWGGRTFMGVDCSGFAQVVFKVLGIPLQRDAYQQAEGGTAVSELQQAKTGDLAFFHNEEGRIIHVGIVLHNDKIIHASGKVRIDTLTKEGIMNKETGQQTHQLHSIKRYFLQPL